MKSIFLGMSAVDARVLLPRLKVGATVCPAGYGYGLFFGRRGSFLATVLYVREFPLGTLALLRPKGEMFQKWSQVPLWISKEGNSGILARWKEDSDLRLAEAEYDWLSWCAEQDLELEVSRAMAL